MKMRIATMWIATIWLGVALVFPAAAETHVSTPYKWESGLYFGSTAKASSVVRETISIPGATCLRLFFSDWSLGPGSEVRITSQLDGSIQRLDAESIEDWRSSAYFNGDTVDLELVAGANGAEAYIAIMQLEVGEGIALGADNAEKSLCGADSRVQSSHSAVGRMTQPGSITGACTAFLVANGGLVSAGHCSMCNGVPCSFLATALIEFNVPASTTSGSPTHANASDSYPINVATVVGQFAGGTPDTDWVVFECLPNSNTGLMPGQAQRSYLRVTKAPPSVGETIRVTGFGLDDDTPTRNYAQQSSVGLYLGENGSGSQRSHEYQVDTTVGASGAPIIWNHIGFAIGIHTDEGCSATEGNKGNSFGTAAVGNAMNDLPGSNTTYVDIYSGFPLNGTILEPYNTITAAVSAVPNGGRINLAPGSYSGAFTTSKPMTLVSPIGTARIGQ